LTSREEIIGKCLQDEPAFCRAVCPYNLDVPDFITKIERGAFNAAFRAYQNAVGFPGIVSRLCGQPCKTVCIRGQVDDAVSMGFLEKAASEHATRKTPYEFNLPAKNKSIAIIGAGPSGLACALRLCQKKYAVTLFDKQGKVGGHLKDLLPEDIYMQDIRQQFMHETYTLVHREIIELHDIITDFDAIYVATGANGRDFGLIPDRNGAFATDRSGVFMGGGLVGKNSCEAIADGLEVVHAIERYLKVGRMDAPIRRPGTRLQMNPERIVPCSPTLPSDGSSYYTKDEAGKEAQRCLKCACDACMRHCDLMRHAQKKPRKVADDVEATIHPGTLAGDGTIAKRFMSSCNHCGLCRTVCPLNIDMGEFLLASHRIMAQKGAMPWAFHDFWLKDMAFSNSDRARLVKEPPNRLGGKTGSCRTLFFPGCRLGGSDPRYVINAYERLLAIEPDTALMTGCCGAPAYWAGEEKQHSEILEDIHKQWISFGKPDMVFACPTCRQLAQRFLPDIQGQFLYSLFLNQDEAFLSDMAGSAPGDTVCIFDPCASRDEPDLQQTVRNLVSAAGLKVEPLPMERAMAQCCSWGGQISIASPGYARQIANSRISQSPRPYVTYCINCRDIFAWVGKPVYHILDILFKINGPDRRPPTLTEQQNNRVLVKRQVLKKFWNEAPEAEAGMGKIGLNLYIPEAVKADLNRKRILESDMEEVVTHCETTGKKIFDPDTGLFTGHLKIGHMTFWAEYRLNSSAAEAQSYELVNGYGHRMEIVES
jgi:Fe-S oxidoreductase